MNGTELKRTLAIVLAMTVANPTGYAQQEPTPAFRMEPVVSPETNIGGHPLGATASIESVAISDSGIVAFLARSTEAGTEHRGCILTPKRVVACDGDVIGGKTITKVTAVSLGINSSGQVGYEATFGDPGQTGVFVDHKFVVTLNAVSSADDFILKDDGLVVLKPGTQGTTAATPGTPRTKGSTKVAAMSYLSIIIPPALRGGRWSPIAGGGTTIQAQSQSQSAPAQATPQQTQPPSKGAPAQLLHNCVVPKFPYPAEWGIGAALSGPIASGSFEDPVEGRKYKSAFFGELGTPFRVVEFSQDCQPLLVVLGDNSMHGLFEFWTPSGFLFRTKPDGSLDLDNLSANLPVGLLVRTDSPIKISRKGQIAFPVKSSAGDFILLATPVIGSR